MWRVCDERELFSFNILDTVQLSKSLHGNDLLSVVQRSEKCLSGANHIPRVLVKLTSELLIWYLVATSK